MNQSFRNDLMLEMQELSRLGVNVPSKAFELAEQAHAEDYASMSNTEVVDLLITLSLS